MSLTLYKLDASPPARAAMMVVEALELADDVNLVDVNLFEEEHLNDDYLKLNPQHTIPTLKDGDFSIWDSHAIATYLVSVYGKDDSLYPKDPRKRAVIDQRLHFDTGILFPAIRNTLFPVLFLKEPKVKQENLDRIEPTYEFCEKFVEDGWMAGGDMTLADISCVASISSLNCLIPIDANKFPKLHAWLDRCSKLDFYVKANAAGLKAFSGLLEGKMP